MEWDQEMEALAYPIGRFEIPVEHGVTERNKWISVLEASPKWYDYSIENLDEEQLNTPYRPGGWTVIQVVHHVADSHMNGYTRLKLALTEDNPTIKPYNEKLWAGLPDVAAVPLNVSITLIHALHRRWAAVLRDLSDADWNRTYYHPEAGRTLPLWEMTASYAWHCRHHFEHIMKLRERMGW